LIADLRKKAFETQMYRRYNIAGIAHYFSVTQKMRTWSLSSSSDFSGIYIFLVERVSA